MHYYKKIFLFVLIIGFTTLVTSCKPNLKKVGEKDISIDSLLNLRYEQLLQYPIDSLAFPRSYTIKEGKIKKVPSKDWTSGFFPGNLWQIFELTQDNRYKEVAKKWTAFVEKEKFNGNTHDMGFKVFCSFGNGLTNYDNKHYKDVIVKSAQTLITRFDKKVGSIRSWDFNADIWQFPVIIDNMMNLELLFEATKISGDSIFHKIAVTHANTTLKNHFREDASTWHVLDYDTISGQVRARVTHQGIHDDSSWARGQGWAINGFTTVYRYTKDDKYLNQAIATANYFMNHQNMPEDGIPYWDFDAPNIPDEPRDVSAAAIVASALIELYGYTNNESYLNYSKKVLNSLQSKNYILAENVEAPFILNHSSGDWSKRAEMDEPIVYGDYYFLEALTRLKNLK
jgi:rhamnogalacturonyl hydrolase YesR